MRWAALLLVGSMLWPSRSFAQQESKTDQADELIAAGVEKRKEGHEAEALELFHKAYELYPTPRALGQLGLAAKSIRRYVEAERYLEEALAAKEDPWIERNREALELALQVVSKQLASLMVKSNVAGADL